jgi:hypothetical protein
MISKAISSGFLRWTASVSRHGTTLLNLVRTPSLPLLYFSAKANLPRLCAVILLACVQRIGPTRKTTGDAIHILALNKSVFIEDVLSITNQMDNVELFLLGRTHLHFVAKAFFRKGTDDNNYHDLASDQIINRYREFLTALWQHLNDRLKIKCALSGNFSYFEERELAYVLEADGVPFVAVHKECLKTPGRIEEYEGLYRSHKGPFWGGRILVYNNIERDLIVRTKVAAADKVAVVGMPRLDAMHRARTSQGTACAAKSVLLISFHKDLNTLESGSDEHRPSLGNIWESVHRAMFELADRRTEVQVTIKTKGDRKDVAWIAELVQRYSLKLDLPNLRVVHGGDIRELLIATKVVCGVHSTALLEALAANKPVIVPEYDELADGSNDRHLVDFGGTVIRVSSRAELMTLLDTELDAEVHGVELPDETRGLLNFWLGNDDGRASERAAAEIKSLIGPAH